MLTVSPIKPPRPLTLAGNQQIQPLDNEHRARCWVFWPLVRCIRSLCLPVGSRRNF